MLINKKTKLYLSCLFFFCWSKKWSNPWLWSAKRSEPWVFWSVAALVNWILSCEQFYFCLRIVKGKFPNHVFIYVDQVKVRNVILLPEYDTNQPHQSLLFQFWSFLIQCPSPVVYPPRYSVCIFGHWSMERKSTQKICVCVALDLCVRTIWFVCTTWFVCV